jgi:hypothetical protein
MKTSRYVKGLIRKWRLGKQPTSFRRTVEKVLMELCAEALLILRSDPRLQVEIAPGGPEDVWAFFPMHRRRLIARDFPPKPSTRVLLVLRSQMFDKRCADIDGVECLRDHLGHTLLYLWNPKARNECADAAREWREFRRLSRSFWFGK